jgi:DNA transformation protein
MLHDHAMLDDRYSYPLCNDQWQMASEQAFVEYVCHQIGDAGSIAFRKMFGEYAIYCEGKVVALVCDNQLFVKATAGGLAFVERVVEASPYPGAKPHLLIGDELDDRAWISKLIRITQTELPIPRTRKPKRVGRSSTS